MAQAGAHQEERKRITSLKHQRSCMKAQLTRFGSFLRDRQPEDSIDQVTLRLERVKASCAAIDEVHMELTQLDPEGNHEEEIIRFETTYFSLVADAERLIRAASAPPPVPYRIDTPQSANQMNNTQLPRITLPTFSGNYLEWEGFRDMFRTLIHEHQGLNNVQRLHYLKTSLSGEAQTILANIAVTDANYEQAWRVLHERYENKPLILHNNLSALNSLTPVAKESANELKRLRDGMLRVIDSLKNLHRDGHHWDDWLVFHAVGRLDPASRKDWETSRENALDFASFDQVRVFLDKRIRALESIAPSMQSTKASSSSKVPNQGHNPSQGARAHVITSDNKRRCPACQGAHNLGHCPPFQRMTQEQRRDQVERLRLCFNCLYPRHSVRDCPSTRTCSSCSARHHSMLHGITAGGHPPPAPIEESVPMIAAPYSTTEAKPSKASSTYEAASSGASTSVSAHLVEQGRDSVGGPVLLATALVTLRSPTGHSITARALLDPGAEGTFISEAAVQQLQLTRNRAHIPISGIGSCDAGICRQTVSLELESRISNDFRLSFQAFVLSKLTNRLPSRPIPRGWWPHLEGITLADPTFAQRSRVDLIIGADIHGLLVLPGLRKGPPGTPIAQQTTLGWVLSGLTLDTIQDEWSRQEVVREPTIFAGHSSYDVDLTECLSRFWELEAIPVQQFPSDEDNECDLHFRQTHVRTREGRYVVRLPVKSKALAFVGTSSIAAKCLMRHERRFLNDAEYAEKYSHFMSEYLDLGHMQKATSSPSPSTYYMPHHGVLKSADPSRKLRVVFNASQRDISGRSLNECLHVGPALQRDLSAVVLRWRKPAIVFTADIQKMFRQILVGEPDRDFQRIFWRNSVHESMQHYQLTTVTYGMACAPYLAIRVLQQLAEDERTNFPLGAQVLLDDFYVDDVLSGADDLESASLKQEQLTRILRAGCFELRKWASNRPELLEHIPQAWQQLGNQRSLKLDEHIRTLGLVWDPIQDRFSFQVALPNATGPFTKRLVLANIARLFDPLGWISPVVIRAKILLQDLWLAGIGWDAPLPDALSARWAAQYSSLSDLSVISLPRWIGHRDSLASCELHGFADASERAYAAAVYVRIQQKSGDISVTLVAARTKVSPVKQVSIPRLELCGIVLLTRLLQYLRAAMNFDHVPTFGWSDSRVALAWIKGHPSKWNTFVANRVSEIQTTLPDIRWAHVSSGHNPADLATRGASPTELRDHALWWQGPSWLRLPSSEWPRTSSCDVLEVDLEQRRAVQVHVSAVPDTWDLIRKFSTLTKLLRVTAFCYRFALNARQPRHGRTAGPLSTAELAAARNLWIRRIQGTEFAQESAAISSGQGLPRSSHLLRLRPFLDDKAILRVGGRLRNAMLTYEEKHPVILPRRSILTDLVIADAHSRTLHGGTLTTLSFLIRHYWILGGRSAVRAHVHRCVRCFRSNARPTSQLMGDLPSARVVPGRPFLRSGLDYAGPILIRTSKGRGHKAYKGYIALFVCLATKAIHLEAVSDCSTQAFLAAFKRFVGRRGICAELWSDNGTNFRGADRELRSMFHAASVHYREVATSLANDGTNWRFIPPAAPHFGGIWEAGVKSTKLHLKRVIGETTLTFEELSTVLVQIEACLNSRPISALSSDPADLAALTPGHFLVGSVLTVVPEPRLPDVPVNRLTRWELTRKMTEDFWRRWATEYLHHLQQRPKWATTNDNVEVNDLVLLKDERLPPSKWMLGRVVATHPGNDGLVRVVTVKTSTTTLKRPISKICQLPRMERQKGPPLAPTHSTATAHS